MHIFKKILILTCSIIILFDYEMKGQGIPFIEYYSKNDYRGGIHSWDFTQSKDGILYVANSGGLLEFDGERWKTYPMPNKTIVRSVCIDEESRIWVGAQREFGYYETDENGALSYISLIDKLTVIDPDLTEIWNLHANQNQIYFRTSNYIFSIENDELKYWPAQNRFMYLNAVNGKIYIQDVNHGVFEIDDDFELNHIFDLELYNDIVMDIIPLGNALLIGTEKGKLYIYENDKLSNFNTEFKEFFAKNRISAMQPLDKETFAVATYQGGVVVLNIEGEIVNKINRQTGLQSNNTNSIKKDDFGNLLVGTNAGIEYILINTPYSFVFPDQDFEGGGYQALKSNDILYFSTSSGVFAVNYSQVNWQDSFVEIGNTKGQTYNLQKFNNKIFIGHHEGPKTLNLNSKTAVDIADFRGAWTFLELEERSNFLIAGSYDGLHLFEKIDDKWTYIKKYENFSESSRILVQSDKNTIWIAHPYKGFFKINLSSDLNTIDFETFNENEYENITENFNYILKLSGKLIFSTAKGLFEYDPITKQFVEYLALNRYFNNTGKISTIVEDSSGNIWYVQENETGILIPTIKDGSKVFKKNQLDFLKGKLIPSFETINEIEKNKVIFGAEKGFIIYDFTKEINQMPNLLIRRVSLSSKSDSTVYENRNYIEKSKTEFVLPYYLNDIKIEFALVKTGKQNKSLYSWKLEGYDKVWSDWANISQKEYSNLKPGKYTFKVRSKVFSTLEDSKEQEIEFEILPPWYRTSLAYFFYIFFIFSFITILIVIPRKQFKKEKMSLLEEHKKKEEINQRNVEKNQIVINKLKQEKLQNELDFKNKELASNTLHLLHKGEILEKIKTDITSILKIINLEEKNKLLKRLHKVIDQEGKLDEEWDQFTQHFDQVNRNFLKRLRDEYPNITTKDQKLCAFLKMNLSSKEIARLLNISVRGVEVSRYRLRKKLNLENDVNLTEFLMDF